ncbi:MAG: alpha/beta hydrolase [Acidimicrobiales bacterium]|nr:alpha/beta hydrolase [Acidimicrobiales bacterium]
MPQDPRPGTPLEALGTLARGEVRLSPSLRHLELYTFGGLLTLLWHGDPDAEQVVLMGGGAMGGLLGPAGGLYHDLGEHLARQGIGSIRVSWRAPNDLDRCVHDLVAAAELAARAGAERFVATGHSFGGAVAVRAGLFLDGMCAGLVTFATQSAGCEEADQLGDTPILLFHGDRDEILPVAASEAVRTIAGHGELVVLPGTGHLLGEARDVLWERLVEWIPARFADHAARRTS